MQKPKPYTLYLIMEGAAAFFFMFYATSSMVYQITVVGLDPLQLVLVGTVLEIAVFTMEVPTGIVADLYGRRLSTIIGMVVLGLGFMLVGLIPRFETILLAQVIWGTGYTFTSGAIEAWITDEIGEEAARGAFLRASQVGQIMSIAGVVLSMIVGSIRIVMPLIGGGIGYVLLGIFLMLMMTETGFTPTPLGERSTWRAMADTLHEGLGLVRASHILMVIMGVSLFYGLSSEGFDRLWLKHLIDNFTLPFVGTVEPVVWAGVVRGGGTVGSLIVTEIIRRKIDMANSRALLKVQIGLYGLIAVGIAGFGLVGDFTIAMILLFAVASLRRSLAAVELAWMNRYIKPEVRATVLSMWEQSHALGELTSGPVMGWIGLRFSLRLVMLIAGGLLSPILVMMPSLLGDDHERRG